jgi:hypothetical protein
MVGGIVKVHPTWIDQFIRDTNGGSAAPATPTPPTAPTTDAKNDRDERTVRSARMFVARPVNELQRMISRFTAPVKNCFAQPVCRRQVFVPIPFFADSHRG